MDSIDDAVDMLEKSGFAYVLVVGVGPHTTRTEAAAFIKHDKDRGIRNKCYDGIESFFNDLNKEADKL